MLLPTDARAGATIRVLRMSVVNVKPRLPVVARSNQEKQGAANVTRAAVKWKFKLCRTPPNSGRQRHFVNIGTQYRNAAAVMMKRQRDARVTLLTRITSEERS